MGVKNVIIDIDTMADMRVDVRVDVISSQSGAGMSSSSSDLGRCVRFHTNGLRKDMNSSLLPWVMVNSKTDWAV